MNIYERALYCFTYGLYVVTARVEDKYNGQIVNVGTQITVEPLRLAICLNKENLTYEYVKKDRTFGMSVLEQETPFSFFGAWGFQSGRKEDKFAKADFRVGQSKVPLLLDHALAVIECKVINEMDVGTHAIFVGEVVYSEVLKEGIPLTYEYYRTVIKGKVPKTAPTYRVGA
ncbi:flavin reductase [bacterium]|nr:flavin reductase [bacterium]